MQVLLFSDIHSNLEAMEACLRAAPACDRVVVLGDMVGYGASPGEVLELFRRMDAVFVRGNHDRICSGDDEIAWGFNPMAARAARWTRERLTDDQRQWLAALPAGPVRLADFAGAQFVHGSPLDENEYILHQHSARAVLEQAAVPLTFFGHTHVQGGFTLDGSLVNHISPHYEEGRGVTHWPHALQPGVRYLVNPGAVGQPRDGDWRAAFAVYNSDAATIDFYRVKYDLDMAQQKIISAGLPDRLALRLAEGR